MGGAIASGLAGCGGDDGEVGENGTTGKTDQTGAGETDQTGTTKTDQTGTDTGELTGVKVYSGEWSGSIRQKPFSGVWQFEANFEEGKVDGQFWGDGEGDITGTLSGGKIDADAKGGAALGTVEWSGAFSPDGETVSGTWELAENMPGSGTWKGSLGKLENHEGKKETETETEEEKSLPEEDQVSGDEPIARYDDSVMFEHSKATAQGVSLTKIWYGTTDSLGTVEDWYTQKFGTPQRREAGDDITLEYAGQYAEAFEQNEYVKIVISEESSAEWGEYTEIYVEYGQSSS